MSSFTSNLLSELESKENVEDEIETIKNCAGLAYAGRLFTIFCVDNYVQFSLTAGAESVSL